jgi:cytochrome c-type biogenesis protein CcmH/NrfF
MFLFMFLTKYRINYSGLNNTPVTKFERKKRKEKRNAVLLTSEVECSVCNNAV